MVPGGRLQSNLWRREAPVPPPRAPGPISRPSVPCDTIAAAVRHKALLPRCTVGLVGRVYESLLR